MCSGPTSNVIGRESATGNAGLDAVHRSRERVGDPRTEPGAQVLGRLDEEVTGTGQDLELPATRKRLYRLARHHRQQLVAIAVQEQEGTAERGGALAAG